MVTLSLVPPSDRSLIQSIRDSDEAAAEELYRRYADRLRRVVSVRRSHEFAARFDADDVIQSVFLRFFKGVQSQSLDVAEEGELWGLLFVLTVNKVEDHRAHHRASKRSVYRTTEVLPDEPEAACGHEGESPVLMRLIVEEYLSTLFEPERSIVALRIAGHSVAEIAEQTGRGLRTVERVLQKSRDQLAEILRP